jgi:hypothetical protein
MKRAIFLLALLIASGQGFAGGAFAHKYHTSVTRLEYDAESRSAEITIQTFTDDLRDVLARRAGRQVRLDASREAGNMVFDYLRNVFELKRGAADKGELQWVGMEVKGETVWLYVMAKMPGGLSKATLRHAFLFDLYDDQVNIVNVINNGKKSSLVFKQGDSALEIP